MILRFCWSSVLRPSRISCIDPRVGVESPIRAFGRKAVGVEDVLEDIRILIAADPPHRVHLVRALGDVAEET